MLIKVLYIIYCLVWCYLINKKVLSLGGYIGMLSLVYVIVNGVYIGILKWNVCGVMVVKINVVLG